MKLIDWLKTKESIEIIKRLGQVFVFILIIILILFFCSLVDPLSDTKTILYSICFLCTLLIILVISGGFEISLGDLFKIKKDTEAIKKEMAELKILTNIKNTASVQFIQPQFPVSETQKNEALQEIIAREVSKYIDNNLN